MCLLNEFLEDLCKFLGVDPSNKNVLLRCLTAQLETLGDIKFSIMKLKYCCPLLCQPAPFQDSGSILDLITETNSAQQYLDSLIASSKQWRLKLNKSSIINIEVHLFLDRKYAMEQCLKSVLKSNELYGLEEKIFNSKRTITMDSGIDADDLSSLSLSQLRLVLHTNLIRKLINILSNDNENSKLNTKLTLSFGNKDSGTISIAGVINKDKLSKQPTMAQDYIKERSVHMHLIALHRLGLRADPSENFQDLFIKLGHGSTVLDLLSNKPNKNIILTDDSRRAATSTFYNCARLAKLIRDFEEKVDSKQYPALPEIDEIDFGLLTQPEEWELVFVYILQFPRLLQSCVCDIDKGVVNPHYLIFSLFNLSSTFAVYYKRVKILRNPRKHLFSQLFARIYLLKALQTIFHITLNLLDIEPVKQM